MTPDKKTVFLANIPNEHQKYAGGTYLNLPYWSEVFIKEEFFKYIEDNKTITFSYWDSIKIYWMYYLLVYKSNKHINLKYHFILFFNAIFFTSQYLIKYIYNKTIGKVRNKSAFNKSENENLISMILQEYIDFIKNNSWYEFDFLSRLKAYYKFSRKSKSSKNFVEIEKVIFLTLSFSIKQMIAKIIKIVNSINYSQINPLTVIELDSIPEEFKTILEIVNIGKYQKNYLLGLPKYKGLKFYFEMLSEDNILYSIAGNKGSIVVSCLFKDSNKINLIKLTPLFLHRIPQTSHSRALYEININQLLLFIKFCESKKITLEIILDF